MRTDVRSCTLTSAWLLLWLVGGAAFPAQAQNLTNCELTDAVTLAKDSVLVNLEEYMAILGNPETDDLREEVIVEEARGLFGSEAKVKSDIDPDRDQPGQIRKAARWDPYDVYLGTIPLLYDTLDVYFSNVELVQLKRGGRVSGSPAFSLAFDRELYAVDEGDRYEGLDRRLAVFEVRKDGHVYRPRVVTLDFAEGGGEAESSQVEMERIEAECAAERQQEKEEIKELIRKEFERREAIAEAKVRQAVIEGSLSRVAQAADEELMKRETQIDALRAQIDSLRTQDEVEVDSLRTQVKRAEERLVEVEREQERIKEEERRKREELEKRIEMEERRQAAIEDSLRTDREEQKKRIAAARKHQIRSKNVQRVRAPGFALGYQRNRSNNAEFNALAGDVWHFIAAGLDFGFGRIDAGLGIPDDSWGEKELPVDNGVFEIEGPIPADSLLAGFISAHVGYPLYLGYGFTLYGGGGYQVSAIQFLNEGELLEQGRFFDRAPIGEASLSWFVPGLGFGVRAAYRRTFAAKHVDWDGLRVSVEWKLTVPD